MTGSTPLRLFAAVLLLAATTAAHPQTSLRTPVLVELFTSEGCSSCPPADALLARLDRDQPIPSAEVIVLSEHVDYWDSLGWPDRFSSHLYTERQSSYGAHFRLPDVYTPQMIVAGRTQINGADAGAAARAIVQAALKPAIPLRLSDTRLQGKTLTATLSLSGPMPEAQLFAALVSPLESTQVRSGENGGRTLRHVGVVRSLSRIGATRDLARAPLTIRLEAPTSPLRLVVFAQAAELGPILGTVASTVPSPQPNSLAQSGK